MPDPGLDPEVGDVALRYVGPLGDLRRASLLDGALDVISPLGPAPRRMRLRPGASARCWADQVATLSRAPKDAEEARSRLDAIERRMEAVRRSEDAALRTCVRWRTAGAGLTFGWMACNLAGSGALVRFGHDRAAIACAILVPLPHAALACTWLSNWVRGRLRIWSGR